MCIVQHLNYPPLRFNSLLAAAQTVIKRTSHILYYYPLGNNQARMWHLCTTCTQGSSKTTTTINTTLCGHYYRMVNTTLCGHYYRTVNTTLCGHYYRTVNTTLCGHYYRTVNTTLCGHYYRTVNTTLCGHYYRTVTYVCRRWLYFLIWPSDLNTFVVNHPSSKRAAVITIAICVALANTYTYFCLGTGGNLTSVSQKFRQ